MKKALENGEFQRSKWGNIEISRFFCLKCGSMIRNYFLQMIMFMLFEGEGFFFKQFHHHSSILKKFLKSIYNNIGEWWEGFLEFRSENFCFHFQHKHNILIDLCSLMKYPKRFLMNDSLKENLFLLANSHQSYRTEKKTQLICQLIANGVCYYFNFNELPKDRWWWWLEFYI